MYKSTRHTKSSTIYRKEVSDKYCQLPVTEEGCIQLILESRTILSRLKLISQQEYGELNNFDSVGVLCRNYLKIRKGRGVSYFKNRGVPDALIQTIPAYLIIAPCLNSIVKRLKKFDDTSVPADLTSLQIFFKRQKTNIKDKKVQMNFSSRLDLMPPQKDTQNAMSIALKPFLLK